MNQQELDLNNELVSNILQKKNVKDPQSIKGINTDVLDPQTINSKRAVFHLKREGVLDNTTSLIVPVRFSNATTRLGIYQGILPIISRASLQTSSGKIIAEQNDAGYLMSMLNAFRNGELVERRYVYERGVSNVLRYESDGGNDVIGQKLNNGAGDLPVHLRPVSDVNSPATEYEFTLKMMFPSLFPWSIPVSMIDDYLVLDVEFETDKYKLGVPSDGDVNNLGTVNIDTNNVKLLCDYIIYDEKTENAIRSLASSSKGLNMTYCNYNVINNYLSGGTNTTKTFRKNIGMASQRVKHLLFHHEPASGTLHDSQLIGGKCGVSLDSQDGNDGQTLNVKVNNVQYFNEDVPTQEFYKELYDCMGANLNSHLCQYMTAPQNILSVNDFYGTPQSELQGTLNFVGVNFSATKVNGSAGNTITVGNTPMEITYKRKYSGTQNGLNINQRVFVAVEKLLILKNGLIMNTF